MSNSTITISALQAKLSGQTVRIVQSNGQSNTAMSGELDKFYSPDTLFSPTGHNGSYVAYTAGGYSVITPEPKHILAWSRN